MAIIYPFTTTKVNHNPSRYIPQKGDKFTIEDFTALDGMGSKEIARLSKLPFLVVEDVGAVPIGEDGNYEWHYEVYDESGAGPLPDWFLKFENDKSK
jgi:hypothetical protein